MLKPLLLLTLGTLASSAAPIIIGQPADPGTGNGFPFGLNLDVGTRYQQVYAAGQFSGTIDIGQILFFAGTFTGDSNRLAAGTWDLFLSTTSKAVNGLDTVNFDANLGGDNQLFANISSDGTVVIPDTWIISGNTFHYDPSQGNLLLDIKSNLMANGDLFLDARNGDANGVFSRAQNFGNGFEDFGLVTGFDVAISEVPEPATLPLLLFAAVLLCGARLSVLRRDLSRR